MTTAIDAEVRATLHAWAAEVQPGPGDPHEAMTRSLPAPGRPGRSRTVVLVGSAAAAAVLGVAALQIGNGSAPTTTLPMPGASETPTSGAVDRLDLQAPTVIFRPSDPGWSLRYFNRFVFDGDTHTTFGLMHTDGRRFTLDLYPTGSRTPGSVLRPEENLTVRGRPAFATDEGPPRYRLDWDEAGVQWEVDGEPFASLDDFAATMDGFAVVDRATWEAWMPAEVVTALAEHPDEWVKWVAGRPVQVGPPTPDGSPVDTTPAR